MELEIPYRGETLRCELPEGCSIFRAGPGRARAKDEKGEILGALRSPLGGPGAREFFARFKKPLVLVNDATRPTPTAKILEVLGEEVDLSRARFKVAAGGHEPPREEGYRSIFGPLWPEVAPRVSCHNARDAIKLKKVGYTSRSTEVLVNVDGLVAEAIVVIGSVEPHYFAGYTGGVKSLIPGIAGLKTIVMNHALAMDPAAAPLATAGNPLREDLEDATQIAFGYLDLFSIQAVPDRDHRAFRVFAGGLKESFEAAVPVARELFCAPVPERFDVVISVARAPMDSNLYQSQKPIEHAKAAAKEDGVIILVMRCPDGLGGGAGFRELLGEARTREEWRNLLAGEYRLGYHRIVRNMAFTDSGTLLGISEVEPEYLERLFVTPAGSLRDALDIALSKKGESASILVLDDASLTVPHIQR